MCDPCSIQPPRVVFVERVLRETLIARGAFLWAALFSLGFAFYWATAITNTHSTQWRFLMEAMAAWVWASWFGLAGALIVAGVARRWWWTIAVGLGLTAVGCAAIAAFYLLAPLFEQGSTPGWYPWLAGLVPPFLLLGIFAAHPFRVF